MKKTAYIVPSYLYPQEFFISRDGYSDKKYFNTELEAAAVIGPDYEIQFVTFVEFMRKHSILHPPIK